MAQSYWLELSTGAIWTESDADVIARYPDEYARRDLSEPDADGFSEVFDESGREIPWKSLTQTEREWLCERADAVNAEAVEEAQWMAAEYAAEEG